MMTVGARASVRTRRFRRASGIAALATLLAASSPATSVAQNVVPLSTDEALRLIAAGQTEATARGVRVSVAVVDGRGDLMAVARMPGASGETPDTAIGTAMLSAIYGRPSGALTNRATSSIALGISESTGRRFRFLAGAVPIVRGGVVIGAIAASGGTGPQDEDIARAALAVVSTR